MTKGTIGPSTPPGEPEQNSLADRTLDRLIGVDQIRLEEDRTAAASARASNAEWDTVNRRFRSAFGRLFNQLRSRAAKVDVAPGIHWSEYLIDGVAWVVMAAIVAAFLYVVYRGLQIAGIA